MRTVSLNSVIAKVQKAADYHKAQMNKYLSILNLLRDAEVNTEMTPPALKPILNQVLMDIGKPTSLKEITARVNAVRPATTAMYVCSILHFGKGREYSHENHLWGLIQKPKDGATA